MEPSLHLFWAYGQRFCWEQQFRDQKSGMFQPERSGLQNQARIGRLMMMVAIAVSISALEGYTVSLADERRRVDLHRKRGLSLARIDLLWIQQSVITAGQTLLAWTPILLQTPEPSIHTSDLTYGGKGITVSDEICPSARAKRHTAAIHFSPRITTIS